MPPQTLASQYFDPIFIAHHNRLLAFPNYEQYSVRDFLYTLTLTLSHTKMTTEDIAKQIRLYNRMVVEPSLHDTTVNSALHYGLIERKENKNGQHR